MEIILIAAMAKNRVIGKDNKMPWHIPEELQLFKKETMGFPMIMGRKTFESFPAPLPGRRHLVLSRSGNYQPEGGEYAPSLEKAIQMCGDVEKIFIIGGGQIFTQGLALADGIRLTLLDLEVEGDAFFPEFKEEDFQELSCSHYDQAKIPFTVVVYRRIAGQD